MTGPKDPPLQRGSGRVLMLGSLVLAVSAAVVLALGAEDTGLLRLGIVAALWAALLGTFAAVRMRREISADADQTEDLRTIYRMELDREIAARREHEMTVERELREQVERRERDEIAALRGELQSLRETLRNLLGGDVLVERVALRAESTRLLPIPDHSRPVAAGHPSVPAGETAAAPRSLSGAESQTRRAGRDAWDVGRWADHPQQQPEPVGVPSRPAAESRPRRDADARPAAGDAAPDIFTRTAAELADDAGAADRSWRPAVATTPAWQPAVSSGQESVRRDRTRSRRDALDLPASAPPMPTSQPASTGGAGSSTFLDHDPLGAVSRQGAGGGRHSRPSAPRYGSTSPASNGNGAHGNGAHGNGAHGNGAHGSGNGANATGSYGSHANRQHNPGRRRAPEETPAGAPSGGRPVGELLAAYGEDSAPRHRRRRADD